MKNKITLLFFFLIHIIIFNSCKEKFQYKNSPNAVTTLVATNVLQVTATVSGVINTDNGASLTARGICYSTVNNPTISDQKKVFNTVILGSYECVLDNLSPSTVYYARAYATNSFGTAYGKVISFTTLAATIPIISSTIAPNLITPVSASSGGVITNSGASNITARGVCWTSTNSIPTIVDNKTSDGSGIGSYVSSLTNLAANTRYNIRAYATNSVGTAYGDVKTFTTNPSTVSAITTTNATLITLTTASTGGTIISDGGALVTARGVCWSSIVTTPTILNSITNNGSGIGSFSSSLSGLITNTTYYVRAYATNSAGTAYGNVISFRTNAATIPTGINTTNISSISQTTANGGGNITSDGGATVTARGICWSSATTNPTILNSITNNGSGIGSFSSSLIGLITNTTYHVRAYATNSAGTAYGDVISFRTTAATIPTGVTTTSVSSISQTTANSGGDVTTDGGAPVTAKGVCWSNSTSSPTISNSTTNNGTGINSYTSSLSGLIAGTTYYVRAYATNSAGTAYGNMITFATLPNLSLGQSYQGGIIAYLFVNGDIGFIAGETHGLIATASNQSTGIQWGCSGITINGTSTAIGTGLTNTTAIVNGCNSTSTAASLCFNLVTGGYSDWYLPSRDELSKLYLNRLSIGGFSSSNYWSSSQFDSVNGWIISFITGSLSSATSKNNLLFVRAVRKF